MRQFQDICTGGAAGGAIVAFSAGNLYICRSVEQLPVAVGGMYQGRDEDAAAGA